MSAITDLALELRKQHGGTAADWQQAIDACGSDERARWLLANAWSDGAGPETWSPGLLIYAAAAARLLEDGPSGTRSVYAIT